MTLIPLRKHPSNLDPSACMVSGFHDQHVIFRTNAGYVAVTNDGFAVQGYFNTQAEAREALAGVSS